MRRVELSSLTGIRFYAALFVYLYHVHVIPGAERFTSQRLLFNLGDLGVSLFFVLSGFILTYNYAETFLNGVSAGSYKGFVWDRLTKIYPVHVLTLLLVLPVAILSPRMPLDWRAVPIHLLLLQCFWPSSTPAFSDSLNVPSWSISCEWFFYLLAPVTMFLVLGNRRRWIPVIAILGYACGLVLFLSQGQPDSTRLYFVSRFAPSRFVEFLVGVFTARVFLNSLGQKPAAASGRAQAAGVVLIIAGAVYAPYAAWPLLGGGLLYVPGSVLLILGLAHGHGVVAAHLSQPWIKRLGLASFSFYLIHMPVLRMVKGFYLRLGSSVHSQPAFWAVLIGTFMVVQTAALLVWSGYEVPSQTRLRGWLAQRRDVRGSDPLRRSGSAQRVTPRYLLLVKRQHPELARDLQSLFATEAKLEVLMERRLVERRQSSVDVIYDRRQTNRRAQPQADIELRIRSLSEDRSRRMDSATG